MNLDIKPATEWTDGKVGLFAIGEELYRPAGGLNQSTLKPMLISPAHYRENIDNPQEPTDAMKFGHILHVGVLEQELFGEGKSHYVKPETYISTPKPTKAEPHPVGVERPWSGNATQCKEWLEAHGDLPVITTNEVAAIEKMRSKLLQNSFVKQVITRGHFEVAAFAIDPESGRMLKCKIDKLLVDDHGKVWVCDLKSTAKYATQFESEAAARDYHIQAGLTIDILTILGVEVEGFIFAVIEKEPPFEYLLYSASENFVRAGQAAYRKCIQQVIECEKTGKWDGYPRTVLPLEIKPWKEQA